MCKQGGEVADSRSEAGTPDSSSDGEGGIRARIAVLPGDGVGPEVVAAGLQVLQAAMRLDRTLKLEFDELPWNSNYYRAHGRMMPEDGLDRLREYDAIYLGAVGDPALPFHVPVWGLILPIRQAFDQYVNLRPVRLLHGVRGVLRDAVAPDIDMLVVRENTEGEYAGKGDLLFPGTPRETALQTAVYSRHGVERVVRYAFELARKEGRPLASVSKANALNYSGVFWDRIVDEISFDYPDVPAETLLVDAAALYMVTQPQRFGIIVAPNLYGDILTDLGAGIAGGMGLAASANLNPEGTAPSMFEPIHGSAPDIAGKGMANPLAAIWAAAMMLGHLGRPDWEERIVGAIESVVERGACLTRDLGGTAGTAEVTQAVAAALSEAV
ncbi:MAG: 3-isopropylmalate dehydrogenase [Chloroflexi bacterium]|nr:MAG: 3-isopropylmalate dehydrogenase [Chloroflexota bacterium]